MSDRPFQVLGLQQIAVGGLDKKARRHFWIDILGLTSTGSYKRTIARYSSNIIILGFRN